MMRFAGGIRPRLALGAGALVLAAAWILLRPEGPTPEPPPEPPRQAGEGPAEMVASIAPAAGDPASPQPEPLPPEPLLPGPPQALLPGAPPPWLANAAPFAATDARNVVAIVIDDLGLDPIFTERAIRLPAAVTLSWFPYGHDLARSTALARANGHELLVHVPMEPFAGDQDPGPDALLTVLSAQEIRRCLERNLTHFTGFIGINNHMGSRFTSDATAMMPVVDELKARGLLFLDSRTTGASIAAELTRFAQVPTAVRDVYLDHDPDPAAIRARLGETEAIAQRRGRVVAVAHPRPATFAALEPWLATLPERGLTLAPLSAVVRRDEERRVAHRP